MHILLSFTSLSFPLSFSNPNLIVKKKEMSTDTGSPNLAIDMERILSEIDEEVKLIEYGMKKLPGFDAAEIVQLRKNMVKERVGKAMEEKRKASRNVLEELSHLPHEVLERKEWLKDRLTYLEMWEEVKQAQKEDPTGWETTVRDTFIAQAKNGSLSFLSVIIGMHLMFCDDGSWGRTSLLHLLVMRHSSERLKIYNWEVLEGAPKGSVELHGQRLATLECPLFPWTTPEFQELNLKILSGTRLNGGEPQADLIDSLFQPEDSVLLEGAGCLPVLDANGQETGYLVDTTQVEAALNLIWERIDKSDAVVVKAVKDIRTLINARRRDKKRARRGKGNRHYGGGTTVGDDTFQEGAQQ